MTVDLEAIRARLGDSDSEGVSLNNDTPDLLALVDHMREVLVAVEWEHTYTACDRCGKRGPECVACGSCAGCCGPVHNADCEINAALTSAGLPDQASRVAARAGMRGGR